VTEKLIFWHSIKLYEPIKWKDLKGEKRKEIDTAIEKWKNHEEKHGDKIEIAVIQVVCTIDVKPKTIHRVVVGYRFLHMREIAAS